MKRILLTGCVLLSTTWVQAQVSDTLGTDVFETATETLYTAPNGGYAFGNNGYGDRAKAQSFVHPSSFVVRGVLLKFGDVQFNSQDSTSYLTVNIYANDGVGVSMYSNSDSIAPGTVLSSTTVPVYELMDDGSQTLVDFSFDTVVIQPQQRFSVGIDLTSLAPGDTVGLVSTTDGDAAGRYDAWELTAQGNWIVVAHPAYSWNLEVDLGIFVMIDENDPAGTERLTYGTDWSLYPNPTSRFIQLDLPSPQGPYQVEMYNTLGEQVFVQQRYFPGSALDVGQLPAGQYTVRIHSESVSVSTLFIKLP